MIRLRWFAFAFCASTAALLLSGCAAYRYVQPDVTLVNVQFGDLTLFETTGTLTVRIANENRQTLQSEGGVFNLELNGLKIGQALGNEPVEIPGLGTATTQLELFVNNLALATRIRGILQQKQVEYRLSGKVYLAPGFGRRALRFDSIGQFDFSREPANGARHPLGQL